MANRFQTPVDSTFINTYTPIPFEDIIALSSYKQNLYDEGLSSLNASSDALDAYKAITGSKDEEYLYNLRQKRDEIVDKYALQDLSDLQVQASLKNDMRKLIDKTALDRITGSYGQWVEENKSLSELMKKGQYNPALFDPSRAAGWDSSTMGQYQNLAEAELDFSQTALPYFNKLDDEFWGLFSQGDYDFMQHGVGLKRIQDIAASAAPNVLATEAGQQLLKKYAYETGISLNDLTAEEAVTVVYDALVDYGKQFAKNQVNQLSKPKSGSGSDPDYAYDTPGWVSGEDETMEVSENNTGDRAIKDMGDRRAATKSTDSYNNAKSAYDKVLSKYGVSDPAQLTAEQQSKLSDSDHKAIKDFEDAQRSMELAREVALEEVSSQFDQNALSNIMIKMMDRIDDKSNKRRKEFKEHFGEKIYNREFTVADLYDLFMDNTSKDYVTFKNMLTTGQIFNGGDVTSTETPLGLSILGWDEKYVKDLAIEAPRRTLFELEDLAKMYQKSLGKNYKEINTITVTPTYNLDQPIYKPTNDKNGNIVNGNKDAMNLYRVLNTISSSGMQEGVLIKNAKNEKGETEKDRQNNSTKNNNYRLARDWKVSQEANGNANTTFSFGQHMIGDINKPEEIGIQTRITFNTRTPDKNSEPALNTYNTILNNGNNAQTVADDLKRSTVANNRLLGYRYETKNLLENWAQDWNNGRLSVNGKHILYDDGYGSRVVLEADNMANLGERYKVYQESQNEDGKWRMVPYTGQASDTYQVLEYAHELVTMSMYGPYIEGR